ncbi:MBL fold metallo-hydrolase [Mucilaginibacter sp. McL0603]|uniref:MBL fold metallo-hydrolase n=1 Tax=Mucilaginibacter sp. McL0603 TaxID=3415670 RepID=UPI003CEC5108
MKRISNNIYQISLGRVNVFVIEDNGLTLIDTGTKGSAGKIFNAIKNAGKNPYDIKRIILTHAHPDHAGSAEEIKRLLRIPVLAHREDAKIMQYGIGFRKEICLTPGLKNWLIYELGIKRCGINIEPVTIDEQLNDHDLLSLLGGIRVIHTPGHSKGHISLLAENEEILIAGDLLSNSTGLGLSVIYENMAEGISSILKVTNLDFDKMVFGHGRPILKDAGSIMRQAFDNYDYALV